MSSFVDAVVYVPTLVLTVLAFGAVIRRLLGVRLGPVRTALAAVVALAVAGPLLGALLPDPAATGTATALLYLLLAVCCGSLAAMTVVVVAEVVLPDGSVPGPVELWRGSRARLARSRRYAQILRIAGRHGLGRFLRARRISGVGSHDARRDLARSLRRALEDGGVTFVKLGQQLSTRGDLLPAEFVQELARLQDDAAAVPWEAARDVLTAELPGRVEEVFAAVDPTPLAAASVAQVHAARLADGTAVVVKVQRPGVAAVVERDLDILRHLARVVEARTAWGRALGLSGLASGFADALREELDFTTEHDNLRAMAAVLADPPDRPVRVPAPVPGLSTRRVLVMERLTGTPLGAAAPALAALGAQRRRELAAALLDAVLGQVLDHGLFHVDLHPGNVLVLADGTLGLLDLGSVGRLDGTSRAAVGRLLAALGSGDSLAAADALLELVDRPDEVDERGLERDLGALIVRFTAAGSPNSAAAFAGLFRLLTAHRLVVPPQVAAVFRTFATLEGTLRLLDPGFDLVDGARAAGQARVAAALGPGRLRRSAQTELLALAPLLRRLPRRVDRLADTLERGRLSVAVRPFADSGDRAWLTGLVHTALLAGIGSVAGVMAALLLGIPDGPQVTGSVRLFPLLGYALLIVSAVLVLRVLVAVFRRDRP